MSLLTVPAMPALRKISERMPAISPFDCVDSWPLPTTPLAGLRLAVQPQIHESLEPYIGTQCDNDAPQMLEAFRDPRVGRIERET